MVIKYVFLTRMALLAHVDFLTIAYVCVFDCKLFQCDLERSLVELGHIDLAQKLKKVAAGEKCQLRDSVVVRSKVVSRLIEKLVRKGLISYTYCDIKDSCYFMDVRCLVKSS